MNEETPPTTVETSTEILPARRSSGRFVRRALQASPSQAQPTTNDNHTASSTTEFAMMTTRPADEDSMSQQEKNEKDEGFNALLRSPNVF